MTLTAEQQASQAHNVRQLVRAAIIAGIAIGQGLEDAEVRRHVHKTLGETGGLPSVRSADDNDPIGPARWADCGDRQVSLFHNRTVLGREARTTNDLVQAARILLDPVRATPIVTTLMRRGTVFYGEAVVDDRVGEAGAIKRVLADRVMAQVAVLRRRSVAPIDPNVLRIPPFPT